MIQTNYRSEIEKLKKGIKFAWIVNFGILWLTFIAAGAYTTLKVTNISNQQIVTLMLAITVIAGVVSAIVMSIVNHNATKILIESPKGDAQKITSGQLYNILEEVTIAARLKEMPDLYVLNGSGVANAYACADGKGNSQVVITNELLQVIGNRSEIQAIMAHEVGHIVQGDSQAMTKLVALTSTTAIIAGGTIRYMFYGGKSNNSDNKVNPIALIIVALSLIFLLVAPILSKIAQSAMSRERESRADATAVELTRNPTGLANALIKLENTSEEFNKSDIKSFGKTMGEVAFFNPMNMHLNLRTHPTTQKRVEDLVSMGAEVNTLG